MRRRSVSAWSGHLTDLMCLWDFSESLSAAFREFLEAFSSSWPLLGLFGLLDFYAQVQLFGSIGPFFGFVECLFHAQAWSFSYRLLFAASTRSLYPFTLMRRHRGWT